MIEMTINDMTCGGCLNSITRVVQQLDPNASVVADIRTKHVKIDSVLSRDAVVAAIANAGYHPVAM